MKVPVMMKVPVRMMMIIIIMMLLLVVVVVMVMLMLMLMNFRSISFLHAYHLAVKTWLAGKSHHLL